MKYPDSSVALHVQFATRIPIHYFLFTANTRQTLATLSTSLQVEYPDNSTALHLQFATRITIYYFTFTANTSTNTGYSIYIAYMSVEVVKCSEFVFKINQLFLGYFYPKNAFSHD